MSIPFVIDIPKGRFQGTVALSYDKPSDTVCGSLTIKDVTTGKIVSSRELCVPIGKIRETVMAMHAVNRPTNVISGEYDIAGEYQIGGLFSDLKKRAHKISKRVGAKKLIRIAQKIMDDPRFAKGAALASTIYPPLGITLGQLRAANSLVTRARSGDKQAQISIAKVAMHAKEGDETAKKAAQAMLALQAAQKAGATPKQAEAELAGWLYNRPYRGNLEAGELNRAPHSILRKMYHDAINRR